MGKVRKQAQMILTSLHSQPSALCFFSFFISLLNQDQFDTLSLHLDSLALRLFATGRYIKVIRRLCELSRSSCPEKGLVGGGGVG